MNGCSYPSITGSLAMQNNANARHQAFGLLLRPGISSRPFRAYYCASKHASKRALARLSRFHRRDAPQQTTQQVGAGDDPLLCAPHQDHVVVDDIVAGPLRRHLH
jgi:hypothetical protein